MLPFGASEVPGCHFPLGISLFIYFSPSASVLVRNHSVASDRKANSKRLEKSMQASGVDQVGWRRLRNSDVAPGSALRGLHSGSVQPSSAFTILSFSDPKCKKENTHEIPHTLHHHKLTHHTHMPTPHITCHTHMATPHTTPHKEHIHHTYHIAHKQHTPHTHTTCHTTYHTPQYSHHTK